MAGKKDRSVAGPESGVVGAGNGSGGEHSDPGITGGIGGASDGSDPGSDGTSDGRIAGLGVADPAVIGTGTPADPAAPFGYKNDGTPRTSNRGRKSGGSGTAPKSGTSKARGNDSQSVKGLEKLLISLHMMAAAATKTPELMLDNQEAAMMASAINAVQNHYDFNVSAEVTIWVNLISASAAVYGPRAVVIYSRKKKEQLQIRPVSEATTPPGIPGMHDPTHN